MASPKNDRLRKRTQKGTLNYYDDQRSIGTSFDKAQAARLGGHNFNPITHEKETILAHARSAHHCINSKGQHNGMLLIPFGSSDRFLHG